MSDESPLLGLRRASILAQRIKNTDSVSPSVTEHQNTGTPVSQSYDDTTTHPTDDVPIDVDSDAGTLLDNDPPIEMPADIPMKPPSKAGTKSRRQQATERANELTTKDYESRGIKLPKQQVEWLDEEVFRMRKRKVTKQDLLARAVWLLIQEVESGEGPYGKD